MFILIKNNIKSVFKIIIMKLLTKYSKFPYKRSVIYFTYSNINYKSH